jgi:hypothetical protein
MRLTVSQSGAHDQILVTVLSLGGGGAVSVERVGLFFVRVRQQCNKSIVSMYSYIHFTCFT